MDLRLIEIIAPKKAQGQILELIKDQDTVDMWSDAIDAEQCRIKVLLSTECTEAVLDTLEKKFGNADGFRTILLPVEASIPRPVPKKETPPTPEEVLDGPQQKTKTSRISREELYSDITKTTQLNWVFVVLILLSAIVASIGILRDNLIYIIAAMVIAPVLGPNVALSLATTLGDIDLSRKAAKAIFIGILTALVSSAVIGIIFRIDPAIPELLSRTEVQIADIILALSAGSAAVLSFTSGLLSALIGVMVAVALLPPLVVLGMALGSTQWEMALGALLLFLTNLICVNLAGVVTFLLQGIRPLSWWESARAKKATRRAIILWSVLLAVLVAIIFLS